MLIRIQDGLIVDHTLIRSVKKEKHSGGTKETLDIMYENPVTHCPQNATLFDQAEIDRVYGAIARHTS